MLEYAGKYNQRFTRRRYTEAQEATYGAVDEDYSDDWTAWGYAEDVPVGTGTGEMESLGGTQSVTRMLVHLRDERWELSDKDRLKDVVTEEELLIIGIQRDRTKRELLLTCERYEEELSTGQKG